MAVRRLACLPKYASAYIRCKALAVQGNYRRCSTILGILGRLGPVGQSTTLRDQSNQDSDRPPLHHSRAGHRTQDSVESRSYPQKHCPRCLAGSGADVEESVPPQEPMEKAELLELIVCLTRPQVDQQSHAAPGLQ